MEAQMMSSSLGAMGPLRSSLETFMVSPEHHQLPNPLKEEIKLLKKDVEEINTSLVNLSWSEAPNRMTMHWMNEVRDLSYDMHDYVESMMHPNKMSDYKMNQNILSVVKKFRSLVKQASERHKSYELGRWAPNPSCSMVNNGQDPPNGRVKHLVGMGESTDKLIKLLKADSNDAGAQGHLKVVSILGPAGAGKSTLAKEVCREIGAQFECVAFVRASRMPDTRRLLRSIISQVQSQQRALYGRSVQDLIDNLRGHLQGKRYFIVIDDLWERTSWNIVKSAFPEDTSCSRILVTTGIEKVALECCGSIKALSSQATESMIYCSTHVSSQVGIYKVEPLSTEDSTELFFNEVFGSNHEHSKTFKEYSDEIIKICGGLPLSIIMVANIFTSQPDNEKLWCHVRKYLISRMGNNISSEKMMREIVCLSYNNLSHHLKTCLLYLNMYPEGYTFMKDDLVKQWRAEGFVSAIAGKDINEVAECYFDDLVCRGLIQPNHVSFSDDVIFYTVHSTVFEIIRNKSIEENFTTVVDYSETITKLSAKVRRLSLSFSNAKYATKPKDITLSTVRSLKFYGPVRWLPSIREFKLLRVLILEFLVDGKDIDLSEIYRLFQLIYIQITTDDDNIVYLPPSMKRFKYLETLEVYARVKSVPSDIVHLPKLLHLRLQGEIKPPASVVHMKSVRKLQSFDLTSNSEDNIRQLGELIDLQDLHLTCSTERSNLLERNLIALVSILGKHGKLKSLVLEPGALCTSIYLDCSSHVSSPPVSLQRFELLPPICIFSRLPEWIGQLQRLCILRIVVRELTRDDVNRISGLQELTVLSLYVRQPSPKSIIFSRAEFPVLKHFKLRCGILRLEFQAETMPRLRSLNLAFNAHSGEQYRDMIAGIENLLDLQGIVVQIGTAPGAEESDRMAAESVFKDAISSHSKPPSISIRRADPVEEEISQFPSPAELSSRSGSLKRGLIHTATNSFMQAAPGAEESDRMVAESVFKDAISSHSKPPSFSIRRADPLEEEISQFPSPAEQSSRSGSIGRGEAMEDLAVSLAKSVVEGAVTKVHAAIEEEAVLRQSAQRDLVFILDEFQMMQSFLNLLDEERTRNSVAKTWVRQLRDLAYNLEDCIEYVIDLDKAPDWRRRLIPSCMAPQLPLDKAVAEIKLLKGRVEEFSLRIMRYKLISGSGSKPVTQQQLVPGASVGATTFDVLNKVRDTTTKMQRGLGDLTKLLTTKKPGGDLGVISVWAAGGNGTDTVPIIREAYGEPEICGSFGCRGWAKLTHPFSPHEFQRSLLIQFHTKPCIQNETDEYVNILQKLQAATEGELVHHFMKIMKEERYLVVLENISSMVDWDTVRAYLPDGKNGSWIIISTQQSEVARLCVGDPCQMFELKQNSAEHSICVFFQEGPQSNDRGKNKQITMVIPNHNKPSSSTNEVRQHKGGYALYASIPTSKNNADMWMDRFPLVGVRKSQMEDLRAYIANARMKGFAVVSVWGIAGVGKSALVRNLYYDIMRSDARMFTMHGWVDVSHPFNLTNFAWSLLSELQSDSPQQNGITNPIQECHQILENDCCLVVIDGLESTEEWDLIRHSLLSTHPRSTIIVITTEASIGTHCCANREEAMYNVKSLEDDQARDLFKKEVGIFPDSSALRDSEDPELRKLISKCGGLPKLVLAVSDFLAPMSVNWMNSAVNLSDRFMQDMETKPEFDNLRGLFGWMHSYFHTCSYYLKPCILYLSIFPQGQSIRRRRLVRRWIAEGYSRDTSNQSAEEIGEKFFSMLLDMSIIQQAQHSVTTVGTRMVLCKVNGFFHEYIISRQKDEELVFELEGSCTLTSQRTGRHLVIKESWDRDKTVFSSIDFSRLRSLTVFGEWKPFFISESMRVLRVLDLEDAMGVTNKCLEQMLKVLPRLKFLSLRGKREICYLPRSFAGLRQLETLDVRGTSIVTLPPYITKLTKLQYIRAGITKEPSVPCAHFSSSPSCSRSCHVGGIEVPAGIKKLTALHTLGAVNVVFSGGKAILKELTQLHKLEVTGVNKKNSNLFFSAISYHVHLESLSVRLSMGNNEYFSKDMFPTQAETLKNLQSLKLYGPTRSVPEWILYLPKLTKLELEITISEEGEVIEVLGDIKELRILRLCVKPPKDGNGNMLNFYDKMNGVEQRCYLNVKILEISCNSELNVSFGSLAMGNLELLTARCHSGSAVKFTGLNKLSTYTLKEVRYFGSLDNNLKMDMENQLNQHPKRPALKLEEKFSSS